MLCMSYDNVSQNHVKNYTEHVYFDKKITKLANNVTLLADPP